MRVGGAAFGEFAGSFGQLAGALRQLAGTLRVLIRPAAVLAAVIGDVVRLLLGCPVRWSGPVRRGQFVLFAVGTGRQEVVNHLLIVPPLPGRIETAWL